MRPTQVPEPLIVLSRYSAVRITLFSLLFLGLTLPVFAQGPTGKSFGVGFSVGDPTAVSFRFWTSRENSWDAAIGTSYLGNPHVHGDYLWHFNDAFNSRIVSIYAGVGVALGFGDKDDGWVLVRYKQGRDHWFYGSRDDDLVVAAKGTFGLNIIPRNTPLDFFLELNPILGIAPGFGFDIMPALGIRFYP
ncbi:MAG: hypothetical protein KFH87_00205 [Bacteroidetes bacterium]|nr:hypothetical protein [Bacteroidota bacterium]